jgi:hypothetical protein
MAFADGRGGCRAQDQAENQQQWAYQIGVRSRQRSVTVTACMGWKKGSRGGRCRTPVASLNPVAARLAGGSDSLDATAGKPCCYRAYSRYFFIVCNMGSRASFLPQVRRQLERPKSGQWVADQCGR